MELSITRLCKIHLFNLVKICFKSGLIGKMKGEDNLYLEGIGLDNEGKENKGNWFRNGILVGAAIGSIYIVSNKKTRTKLVDGVGNCTNKAKNWYAFIKENKKPFLEQMRATSNKIATIVEEASDDIQTLVETSQHMKEHTMSLVNALQETKEEFQTLTARLKNEETLDVEDVLPPSGSQDKEGEGKLLQ